MKKIGFIGAGNMATAIIKGLMAQNDSKADFINVFDVSEEKCAAMKNMGANVMTSADEIAKNSSIVVLAVKPQNYPEVLESLKNSITTAKTVVSIAAGISIAYVRKGLECDCPVVRVMPNTPLLLKRVQQLFVRQRISVTRIKRSFTICLQAAAFANILTKAI